MRKNKYIKPEIIVLNISDGGVLLFNTGSAIEGKPEEIDSKENDSFGYSHNGLWDETEND